MMIALKIDWMMTLGATIAFGGTMLSIFIVGFCMQRMTQMLESKEGISWFEMRVPFSSYKRFKQMSQSKSEEGLKYSKYISTMKKFLLVAPIILIVGLLIMVVGSGL